MIDIMRKTMKKDGAEVMLTWNTRCQHCAVPFKSISSKRVHTSGCSERREKAGQKQFLSAEETLEKRLYVT